MFNYRYPEVIKMVFDLERDYSTAKLTDALCTKELVKLGAALGANIERVSSLAALPAWLVDESHRLQLAADMATFKLTGTLTPTEQFVPSFEEVVKEKQLLLSGYGGKYRMVVAAPDGSVDFPSLEIGADTFAILISTADKKWPRTATTLLYSSLIVGSYTAFEALATDLWLESVNLRPKSLAKNMLLPQSAPKNDDTASPDQEPTIRLSDLADYDFNVATEMGKLLKERRRANFESLRGIQSAYESAFRLPEDKAKRTSEGLKNLFRVSYPELRVLESLRNLIVHRGGKIDEKFRSEVKSLAPDLYAAHEGEALELSGDQVSKYVMAAAKFSSSLLRFVDQWLDKYKE